MCALSITWKWFQRLSWSLAKMLRDITCKTRFIFDKLMALVSFKCSGQVWCSACRAFIPCSTHLSMKFSLLINMKMPTIVGFLAHLSWKLKVSFCDHSPSVVVVVVRMSVRPSVRPSTIFKQHLLLNHWLDFDQTLQEWSLVGPLSKLFKWFQSVAYLGHRS